MLTVAVCICAYLLYRLVKAVEAETGRNLERGGASDVPHAGEVKALRSAAIPYILTTLGTLEFEVKKLARTDFLDGSHVRECYIDATKNVDSLLFKLTVAVRALQEGNITEPDYVKDAAEWELLFTRAKAEVHESGYKQSVARHTQLFAEAVQTVLQKASAAFNPVLTKPDPTVSEAESMLALTALPYVIEQSRSATRLARAVFDFGAPVNTSASPGSSPPRFQA